MSTKTTKANETPTTKHCVGITPEQFAQLGNGAVAYIHKMTPKKARRVFPKLTGLPRKGFIYSVHEADGSPIAITDEYDVAYGHATDGERKLALVH